MGDENQVQVEPGQQVSEADILLERIRRRREACKPRTPPAHHAAIRIQDLITTFLAYTWMNLASSPPVQLIWKHPLFQYIYSMIYVTLDVFLQKLGMLHLDEVDYVGGPAEGLTAIVTGPTSGIGAETASALARRGARVVLACRTLAKGEELRTQIESTMPIGRQKPDVKVMKLDLASLKSVREFADQWKKEGGRPIHILVNNAGIFSMGAPREETEDGFESHMGANHLGHFLLTLLLVPYMRRGVKGSAQPPEPSAKPTASTTPTNTSSSPLANTRPGEGKVGQVPALGSTGGLTGPSARIVNVSSSLHALATRGVRKSDPHFRLPGGYTADEAYAQSKLAQVLFVKELRRRLGPDSGIQTFAVHPGMVLTNVTRTLPQFVQKAYRAIMGFILLTPSQGSRASVYAATGTKAAEEGMQTGGYFNSNCKPIHTSPSGSDMDQALWLWKWSAEQVHLPIDLNLPETVADRKDAQKVK